MLALSFPETAMLPTEWRFWDRLTVFGCSNLSLYSFSSTRSISSTCTFFS
jgi:hypothetical protein